MLTLHQKTLKTIKGLLLKKQREVSEELKQVEKEDPVRSEIIEASEPGTDSWIAEGHTRLVALRDELLGLGSRIRRALHKIKIGTYGKCENCGQAIDPQRLMAMPTAQYCLTCSKKFKK